MTDTNEQLPVQFEQQKIGITTHTMKVAKFTSTFIGNGKGQAIATIQLPVEGLDELTTVYTTLVSKYFENKGDSAGNIKPIADENSNVSITFPKKRKTKANDKIDAEVRYTKNNFTVSSEIDAMNAEIQTNANENTSYDVTVRLSPWAFKDPATGLLRSGATAYAVALVKLV